ncbi:phasin family protein [Cupriavidus sp. WKF15]|uniref:phasin family protein n=1 Tax=Cupriavidus sp. WKF15 TaxID=3032282 RepID=UPI0023E0E082|nr:phasin family protein [Cupriavidus sp. WKF15]WER49202.1 phasin family protein [Cupriavidus sp. WKF15]
MPEVNLQPVYAAQAAAMDIVFGMTTKTLDACQKLTELGMQTMKGTIVDSQEAVRQALAARNPQDLFALQATAAEPAAEKARAYFQQVQEIAAATREEFQKVAAAQLEANKRAWQEIFDKIALTAPGGSDGALNAWQAAMASGITLCESMQASTRQAVELAESQVANVAAAAAAAAHKGNSQSERAVAKR